jgi:hypothetical protein
LRNGKRGKRIVPTAFSRALFTHKVIWTKGPFQAHPAAEAA